MSVNIDITCNICGSNDRSITYTVGIKDSKVDVCFFCKGCGTKTLLTDIMEETPFNSNTPKPIRISKNTDTNCEYWMVGFDDSKDMHRYTIYSENLNLGDNIVIFCEFKDEFALMSDSFAEKISVYYKDQSCYKNYKGLLDSAWDCQTAKESLRSLSDKKYWIVYRIVTQE